MRTIQDLSALEYRIINQISKGDQMYSESMNKKRKNMDEKPASSTESRSCRQWESALQAVLCIYTSESST